jgi:hypothetical protein
LSYRGSSKGSYGSQIRYAKKVQSCRSSHAKAIDEKLKAPKAKDVDQWLSAPNRFDLPNVDTNKPKKKAKSMRVSEKVFWENDNANKIFDRLINKDNLDFSIPTNKKAYDKILTILEKNEIPYYIGEGSDGVFDYGVQVQKKDMTKAEKLTEKYAKILYNSVQ